VFCVLETTSQLLSHLISFQISSSDRSFRWCLIEEFTILLLKPRHELPFVPFISLARSLSLRPVSFSTSKCETDFRSICHFQKDWARRLGHVRVLGNTMCKYQFSLVLEWIKLELWAHLSFSRPHSQTFPSLPASSDHSKLLCGSLVSLGELEITVLLWLKIRVEEWRKKLLISATHCRERLRTVSFHLFFFLFTRKRL
jgi:hypothetical protein